MNKDLAIPLAYFIIFTCYGTWLHGEKPTSVEKHHNIPGTDFLSYSTKRASKAKAAMTETPYVLDETRRVVVLNAIKNVCIYKQWTLLAAHIRSNHVHIVVHAIITPESIMNTFKAYASRLLNELKLDMSRDNRWTRHGSTKYLWKEEEVEATIQYVIHEQGEPMAFYENRERKFVTIV